MSVRRSITPSLKLLRIASNAEYSALFPRQLTHLGIKDVSRLMTLAEIEPQSSNGEFGFRGNGNDHVTIAVASRRAEDEDR